MKISRVIAFTFLGWIAVCVAGALWRILRFATFPPSADYETRWDFQLVFFFFAEFLWLTALFGVVLVVEIVWFEYRERR
ncbi:MAG: hypothetical protein AB7U82_17485 [Blastocatellales bacterium]